MLKITILCYHYLLKISYSYNICNQAWIQGGGAMDPQATPFVQGANNKIFYY